MQMIVDIIMKTRKKEKKTFLEASNIFFTIAEVYSYKKNSEGSFAVGIYIMTSTFSLSQ